MSYREELIQVAAVAVAIVEDLDYGSADSHRRTRSPKRDDITYVVHDVVKERYRQDEKWGAQHHAPANWLVILMEEVGEAAQAALQEGLINFGG